MQILDTQPKVSYRGEIWNIESKRYWGNRDLGEEPCAHYSLTRGKRRAENVPETLLDREESITYVSQGGFAMPIRHACLVKG